jgi:ankyrin repeat protein
MLQTMVIVLDCYDLCNKVGESPLLAASMYKHCYVVEYLLEHGADVNLFDEDGESPLSVGSKSGDCDVVKCLLNFHASDS